MQISALFSKTVRVFERIHEGAVVGVNAKLGVPYLHTCGLLKDEEASLVKAWFDIIDAPKDAQK